MPSSISSSNTNQKNNIIKVDTNNDEEEEEEENKIKLDIFNHNQTHEIVQKQDDENEKNNEKSIQEDQNKENEQNQEMEYDQGQKQNTNNENENGHNDNEEEEEEEEEQPKNYLVEISKDVLCTACHKVIDEKDIIYYTDLPYHKACVKCMKCNKSFESSGDLDEYICITPGLFLCHEHYEQYQASKDLPEENLKEYHAKNKENFIKELFEVPFINDDNTLPVIDDNTVPVNDDNDEQTDELFITKEITNDLIPKDRPFEDFIPTAIFKFDKQPQDIDFNKFQEMFGDEVIILSVEHGCTILKIAFLSIKKLSQKVIDGFKNLVQNFKAKLASTIGKPVVGNIIDEPIITVPNDSNIKNAYNKPSLNLLQNTSELNSIDIETMKNEVLGTIHKEKVKKNWSYIFSHEDMFKRIEEQVRNDLKINEFEMIVVAQTIIANKHIDEFENIKNKIPISNMKQVFVYHGSKLANHQKIVKKHFLMPGQDKMEHQLDSGYYGKGIYATENLFYAAKYANGYCDLGFNEKTHVICCIAIYNDSKVKNLNDLSWFGKKIEPEIANNYGINHAFVGSSTSFHPIPETEEEKNKNYISANEYVFPSKYQIIPMCSFTLMRKEYYILWKDEHIENNENANYLNELSKKIEVNVYSENDVNKALDIIRKKKRNKIKLITNGGVGLTGKELILEARKITKSNFVCLVFASSPNHYNWVKELENVLFTTSPADFKEFAAIDLCEKPIIDFVHKLENSTGRKFNINEKELLNFPMTSKSMYQ